MQQIGPYRIVEEIARGGMGVVYRALGAEGEVVALKLLLEQGQVSPVARRRFQSEVKALARLRHPNVVAILEEGEHAGAPWLAMELVEGESLASRLRRGPLAIHEALRVSQQLAQALSYVHGCGMLHRDLKPGNVLLRGDQALLTDFGLVRDEQDEAQTRVTATGVFMGTPGYWSPEQASGSKAEFGPRTDVYGLGAVLYACLTGEPPVNATSLAEYLQTQRFRLLKPPQQLRAEALADLARALELDPENPEILLDRGAVYEDLGRLAEALDDCDRALELDATRANAYCDRGGVLGRLGRDADALVDFDRALELDPRHAQAYVERGGAKARLGRFEEGLEDMNRGLELNPLIPGGYRNRGAVLSNLGRRDEAVEDFSRAIEASPDLTSYKLRGYLLAELERYVEAVRDYSRALELDPEDGDSYLRRAVILIRLERTREALADLDRALTTPLSPDAVEFARGQREVLLKELGQ